MRSPIPSFEAHHFGENPMRPLLLALPALLALSAAAAAGPQRLDEGRLAAGQDLGTTPSNSFSLVTSNPITTTNTLTSNYSAGQSLSSAAHNSVTTLGLSAIGVTATGGATSMVSGMIGVVP